MTALLDTPMTDELFRAEFLGHAQEPEPDDAMTILNDYVATRDRTIKSATDLGIGERGIAEITAKAGNAFIKRWMRQRYATVNLSFTDRKWYLRIERDEKNITTVKEAYAQEVDVGGDPALVTLAEIDRFFHVEYELSKFAFGEIEAGERKASQRAGVFRATRKYGGMSSVNLTVSAVLPDGVGQKHVKIAQEALGHYHLARAVCYARGIDIASDMIPDRYSRESAKVRIIWGPNVDVLTVTAMPPRPAGDPAIILALNGENYLLDFYDTPDETPISNLIREFSEGKLPKMKT